MRSTNMTWGSLIIPVALFITLGLAVASNVSTPHTFVGGTTALSAEVNANFAAHEAAINDNDTRIQNRIVVSSNSFDSSEAVTGMDVTVHELGSVTIDVPASGTVTVIATGHNLFAGDTRTVAVGVNSVNTVMHSRGQIETGRTQGVGALRYVHAWTTMNTFPVTAGTHTFYILAQGNAVADVSDVILFPRSIVATFVAASNT